MRLTSGFLGLADIPHLARRNYLAELRHVCLWGFVVGAVEGTIASVVAAKTFHAPETLTAIVFALPNIADVFNLLWGVAIRGRRRIRTFTTLAGGALLVVASIALNRPTNPPWAAWLFAAQIACTHLFLSGLTTLQTTIWKVNYPASHRARIAGRLQAVRMLLVLACAAGLSVLFDRDPTYYRMVYPGVAVIGLASLVPLGQIRMRGEKAELRHFHRHLSRHGQARTRAGRAWAGLREAATILRTDRSYGKYIVAQFLLGSANFFTDPVLVNILARRLNFAYYASTLLMSQIPYLVMLLSIPYWARLFDRVGVLRFRVYNSELWLGACGGVTVAMALLETQTSWSFAVAMFVLVIGRILLGLARGGGVIAWNLGHLHFARDHQTELYMGIHVALTGLRGCVMPLLGLYTFSHLGWGSFAVAMGLAFGSHVLYRRLARDEQRAAAPRAGGERPPVGQLDVT